MQRFWNHFVFIQAWSGGYEQSFSTK